MSEQSSETNELGDEPTSTRNADSAPTPQKPPGAGAVSTREAEGQPAAKNAAWRSWAF